MLDFLFKCFFFFLRTRVVSAKLAKMMKEVDAMLESSESEKGETEDEYEEDSDDNAEEDESYE